MLQEKTDKKVVLLVIFCFAVYYFLSTRFQIIKSAFDYITHQGLISYILTYLTIGIPIFIGAFLADRKVSIFNSLGLATNIFKGLWISVLFTFPMFVGGLLCFKLQTDINTSNLIAGTIVAGFMEELYFRGFLFGLLFKKTRLGFILSVIIGAIIFACGHLYQSQNLGELIGIFMITFSGAVFFAWLYAEWNYNLWVPIFTHTLMNFSWWIFNYDSSALGSTNANIFRGLTITTAIVFTLLYKKKRKKKLAVNRQTLFLQSLK